MNVKVSMRLLHFAFFVALPATERLWTGVAIHSEFKMVMCRASRWFSGRGINWEGVARKFESHR